MKVFFAIFPATWVVVVVLYDQQFYYGEGDAATIITASLYPFYYWGTNIFFAGLFIFMIVLCIRHETAFRETVSEWRMQQSRKEVKTGSGPEKSVGKRPKRRVTRRKR